MLISKIRKILALINLEQSTLNKFFPNLPEPEKSDLLVGKDKADSIACDSKYNPCEESGITSRTYLYCVNFGCPIAERHPSRFEFF